MFIERNGIVYSGGQAWVGAHDAWLKRQRFDSPLVQAAFDEAYDSVITLPGSVIVTMNASKPWPLY